MKRELGRVTRASAVKLTLYRWAGRRWFWEINSPCQECDLAVTELRDLERELGPERVQVEIKPWLDYLFEALRHGGFHAPILLVNGRLFSQGVVPDRSRLRQRILLQATGKNISA